MTILRIEEMTQIQTLEKLFQENNPVYENQQCVVAQVL